jgi:hypothetical protein
VHPRQTGRVKGLDDLVDDLSGDLRLCGLGGDWSDDELRNQGGACQRSK